MTGNDGSNIPFVVLLLTVPSMWLNCSGPVDLRVRGAGESSVTLSVELASNSWKSMLPMLGLIYLEDKDRRKGEWRCRQLHDLDDEVGNVTFRIVRKATLRSDYVALGGGEEGCEDCIPWPRLCVFSTKRVCGTVL
jgi:hypothetical protein